MRGRAQGKPGTCSRMLQMPQMPRVGCLAFSQTRSNIRTRGKSPLPAKTPKPHNAPLPHPPSSTLLFRHITGRPVSPREQVPVFDHDAAHAPLLQRQAVPVDLRAAECPDDAGRASPRGVSHLSWLAVLNPRRQRHAYPRHPGHPATRHSIPPGSHATYHAQAVYDYNNEVIAAATNLTIWYFMTDLNNSERCVSHSSR